MRKSFLSLVMLATVPVQASAWLNSMPAYKSQISINFINLLGNEQAEVINKGLKSASENPVSYTHLTLPTTPYV